MLDDCVGAREQQGHVTAVVPSNEERSGAVGPAGFEHLSLAIGLPDSMAFDHDLISVVRSHGHTSASSVDRSVRPVRRVGQGTKVHTMAPLGHVPASPGRSALEQIDTG
jgi:hypothetical protein